MKNSAKKKSLNPADWERATLHVIAHEGVGAVAIEPLARKLGVTKGSFYWHFNNRMDLINAALRRWREGDRAIIRERILHIKDPTERLKAWFKLSAEPWPSHQIYSTLLADRQHPDVARVLKAVTVDRLTLLKQSYIDIGFDESAARHQALLAYSVYVGYLHMARTLHGDLQNAQSIEAYAEYVCNQLM